MDVEFTWIPMWLAQVLRGFCILAAPACIIFSFRVARRLTSNRGQHYRFIGLGFLLMAATYNGIIRWNEPAMPVLFLYTLGIVYTILGLRSYLEGKETRHG